MNLVRTLELARAGDQEARDQILERFYPKVQKIVHNQLQHDFRKHHRWIMPLFSTGDIVQEVFVGVVNGLDGFEGENEEALAQFLSAIVRNRLLDALRYHEAGRRDVRRKVEEPTVGMGAVAPAVGDPTPSLAASVGEQLRVYREVLLTLPERQRMLLRLRLENEMPFAEIAEKLGHASADAARKAFRDAQARMLVKLRARGIKPPGEATAW